MTEKVFLNNKLVDIDKACVSVNDSGLLYGAGLFETMRCCNGTVFRLDDHLDRLFTSAEKLTVNNSYEKEFITDAIYKLLSANELKDARLRLTLTSGYMGSEEPKSTLLIAATKFIPYPDEYYKNGVLAVLCEFRQNPTDPLSGHKSLNYFSRMLALKQAHEKNAAEALWFTTGNILAEGCVSNIFLVKDSALYTPTLNTPVLAGIARKNVCQLAVENSIKLVEKDLSIDDVLSADEIFMTNVIMQVLPINRVEKHVVGSGKVGEITEKIMEYFSDSIQKQCRDKK